MSWTVRKNMKTIAIAIFFGLSLIAGAIYFKDRYVPPTEDDFTSRISAKEIKNVIDEKFKTTFPDGDIRYLGIPNEKDIYIVKIRDIRTNDNKTKYKIYYDVTNTRTNHTDPHASVLDRDVYGIWSGDMQFIGNFVIKETQ